MGFKIIYEPKGRAREYADLALNLYNGCSFGCNYCYAPLVLKKDRSKFHSEIKARNNVLEEVKKDCELGLIEDRRVLLCFTCDPYQQIDEKLQLTREVIKLFKHYNVSFTVLTKAGKKPIRDFDLYKSGDSFGASLTFFDTYASMRNEPNAAIPLDRLMGLYEAHDRGIRTWVSLEPVINPIETLKLIEATHKFVDLYRVGTINYSAIKKEIDWKDFGTKAIKLFEHYGKEYYIKDDLKAYLEV